ncbi:hypothetical protein FJY69_08825 [candidate division WOR-3 bacterium]|nr:hypothetical protein [candidate division WOR-3 bacterium]
MRLVGDSLGWVMATCHRTRNRRDVRLNDRDIVRTVTKLLANPRVDSNRVFLFGFSGQGVQALATMFLHPDLVRGVVAVCPHDGAMARAEAGASCRLRLAGAGEPALKPGLPAPRLTVRKAEVESGCEHRRYRRAGFGPGLEL